MTKPKVKLIGENGNAFNIISLCKRAARTAGWDKTAVDNLVTRMFQAGSYDKLLQIVITEFDVEWDWR